MRPYGLSPMSMPLLTTLCYASECIIKIRLTSFSYFLAIKIRLPVISRDGNRIEIASLLFFPKKIASKLTKNRICYRILKLNKNILRLFRFFNKLSTVLYLVVSCDCFVIITFRRGERKVWVWVWFIASQCISALHTRL